MLHKRYICLHRLGLGVLLLFPCVTVLGVVCNIFVFAIFSRVFNLTLPCSLPLCVCLSELPFAALGWRRRVKRTERVIITLCLGSWPCHWFSVQFRATDSSFLCPNNNTLFASQTAANTVQRALPSPNWKVPKINFTCNFFWTFKCICKGSP